MRPRKGQLIPFRRRRPGPPPPPPRDESSLVEVYRCHQAEAVVVKSLFESEGIPTLLRSQLAHSVHPFSVGDQGEVVILVPPSAAEQSRLLLARIASGPSVP